MIEKYNQNKNKLDGSKDGNLSYLLLKLINGISGIAFFSIDHVFWAYLAGLHKNRDLVKKVGDIADYLYILQSLVSITTNLIDMYYLQREIRELDSNIPENIIKINNKRQLITEICLENIKYFTDMIVCYFNLDRYLLP